MFQFATNTHPPHNIIQAAEGVMMAAFAVEVTGRTLAYTSSELRKAWRIMKGDAE